MEEYVPDNREIRKEVSTVAMRLQVGINKGV